MNEKKKKKREKDADESDHIHSPSLDKLIDLFLLLLLSVLFDRDEFLDIFILLCCVDQQLIGMKKQKRPLFLDNFVRE